MVASVDGFCTVVQFALDADFGGVPLDAAEQARCVEEARRAVSGTVFLNTFKPMPVRRALADGGGAPSSELDVSFTDEPGPGASTLVHHPPVKRRLAPTLLGAPGTIQ